jgi:DNA (cytosine-5)-methyltransferase 1
MSRPRLLDLFCCQGGAAMGYHRAGFDVVGIDIEPQPRYPFEFVQADALEYLAEHGREFDAIHASPPCQDHSSLAAVTMDHGTGWMLAATIGCLDSLGRPYVVENVEGADLDGHFRLVLCGSMFGLGVTCDDGAWRQLRRHRQFVTNTYMMQPPCSHDRSRVISIAGHTDQRQYRPDGRTRTYAGSVAERQVAMGIDWMTRDGVAQAIPPAYTEFIGEQLLAHIREAAA